ncbi:hypothetical protein KKF84_02855 [Myxococcota bacterium]|nr:hypothetical protein [Myxococcota bacterium]MBU1534229.1 hypothetical protein [Myxococcota bacterium]
MENEQKMMELLEQFHPVDRTFSSLQLTLAHPEADFTSLVQGLTPLIDNSRDSIVLLYCCEGEDHILDLGVRMKIEYS